MVQDAEDGAVGTVAGPAGAAYFAGQAAAVDLPDNPSAGERACPRHADELVSEDALKSHVAAHELQVGLADAGAKDIDHDLALAKGRRRVVVLCRDAISI
jgi:hypothetical protein